MLLFMAVIGGGAWCLVQMGRMPDLVPVPIGPADGARAQQKIFELVRRTDAGRPYTVSLSEREVNAFVRRHLGGDVDLPLQDVTVRLPAEGQAEIVGPVAVRQLCASAPCSVLTPILPERVLQHRVWITLVTRVAVETPDVARARHRVRLDVSRFHVGRLRLPAVMVRVLFDPSALGFLRWPLPPVIQDVRIEPGRLILQGGA